jgi:uncharacterized membrane protein/mono/diheme cytochrome c family protein
MTDLQTKTRRVSKDSQGGSAPSEPPQSPQPEASRQPAAKGAGSSAARELFRRRCDKCHGADGTGSQGRDSLPEIPDFTDASWQSGRHDEQLLASILDGKDEMPAWRGKISEEHARSLLAYVRTFAPTTGKSGPIQQEEPTSTEPDQAEPPSGFAGKLIRWLGKFHPPAVNFPIALLTVAALAEFLRMVTGKRKRSLNAVARYCLGLGTFTAVIAGILGWFLGGFRLIDGSWVKMTHRWLGTSTVALAGLALVLSEASRRPDRRRTRIWFRVTLLILAMLVSVTGYFGGALVFGLKHYTWPK